MAGNIFDSTAFSAALKDMYAPEMVNQTNDNVVALKLFGEESDEEWQGNAVKYPIVLERGQSFMAHGALGVFPDAQNETTVQVSIPVKWIRGRILFSKEAMEASRTSRGAWARSNQFLMTRMVANLTDERNRMINSTGTGILCLVNGAGANTTTLNVDGAGGIAPATAGQGYGTRYLQPNMIIAITDGTTLYSVRQISSITTETDSAGAIVLNSAVSATDAPDNAYVVRAANFGIVTSTLSRDTSYNNEPMGLDGIIDDGTLVGTFQNVIRSNYPLWKSTVISVSTFSLSALQQLTDTIQQVAGEPITDFLVHHSVRRAYLSAIDTTRQFVQANKAPGTFDLGLEPQGIQVSYNGMPIHADKDARLGSWKAVNRNHLFHYTLIKGGWAEDVGNVLRWTSTDQDAFEAIYRIADNMGTDKCNAHGQLTDMTQTNAIRRHVY